MPDIEHVKFKPKIPELPRVPPPRNTPDFAEIKTTSNFSFLRGASHPEELVAAAARLHYRAIAITDYNSLAGVVRAHVAAKEYGIQCIVGSTLTIVYQPSIPFPDFEGAARDDLEPYLLLPTATVVAYPTCRESYGRLCRLLTLGKRRVEKGECLITLDDLIALHHDLMLVLVPPIPDRHYAGASNLHDHNFLEFAKIVRERVSRPELLSIAITKNYTTNGARALHATIGAAQYLNIPLVASNDVYYHDPQRRILQDVVTCVRFGTTIQQAGYHLFENAERYLKSPREMARLFSEHPGAIRRSCEIADATKGFSLDQLRYEYPDEICPEGRTPLEYLTELVEQGSHERYPAGIPEKVRALLREELQLIHELRYEKYFLTCHDIVKYARSIGILCQGRGAAANSAVCYVLGITAVDPDRIDLLFARFVSRERNEPPDIDIDFEHERREEVIQYVYEKYGRDRAGIVAEVISYRQRSAVRDVGKALGLPNEAVDRLAKSIHRWTRCVVTPDELREIGLDPDDITIQNTFFLSRELIGFPRHLSQHVGGFVISRRALCESVPILNAAMEDRTIIEWDKDDIDALGMLKIDVLALGMLTCIRKAIEYVNARRMPAASHPVPLQFHEIPAEDPRVYDMACAADTIGVFQIESRAQMSMLPRLKPREFYDLVVQVAIVRPGPIQGDMVHPYLRRRSGQEKIEYPDERVKEILGRTLGVPLFQEQAMRLAIVLADFSPDEAEALRRAMGAWKRNKHAIEKFRNKIVSGMLRNGYTEKYADNFMHQIEGFSEYGFPESHAASFAVLVYASLWLKRYYPAEFAAGLINSQPMGFYAPSQILSDAKQHGAEIAPIDVNYSHWDCALEKGGRLRLGMRLVKGVREEQALLIAAAAKEKKFDSLSDLWLRSRTEGARLRKATLLALARADAFDSLGLSSREALWEIRALPEAPLPLDRFAMPEPLGVMLPGQSLQQEMFNDYAATGLSLKAHPIQFLRPYLNQRMVSCAATLRNTVEPETPQGVSSSVFVSVAGIAIVRQRPGTARGMVFITLEDETGIVNLVIRPQIFEKYTKVIISSSCILAHGKLERTGVVIYINVNSVEDLDGRITEVREVKMPSLTYSY